MGLDGTDSGNPHVEIGNLFKHYNKIYFEGKLVNCTLKWSSKRMTAHSGLCHYSKYVHGRCDIVLSDPLLKFRPVSDLKNTLLHEMIHAYIYFINGNTNHDDHGPCFQNMMEMINTSCLEDEKRPQEGYAITVYHQFTEEGDSCQTHHWRCANCGDMVRMGGNHAPSVTDCFTRSDSCTNTQCHWHTHEKICGGRYNKISESAIQIDEPEKPAVQMDEHKLSPSQVDEPKQPATEDVGDQLLDGDLMDVASGQERICYTSDGVILQRSLEQHLLDVEMDGEENPSEVQVACQEESSHQQVDESKYFNFRRYFCNDERVIKGNEVVRAEDSGAKKSSGIDVRNILFHKRISSTPVSEGEDDILSRSSRQDTTGREASRMHQSPPRRKRRKTMQELIRSQVCKEPLVILAWANWVSYESDEESEEPLINKRTERRRQASRSEVFKGKAAMDENEELKLVAMGMHHKSDLRLESCPLQNSVQADNDKLIVIDDNEVGVSEKDRVTENKNVPIELSDDESTHKGHLDAHISREEHMHRNQFVIEKGQPDWTDLESEPPRQEAFTGLRRRRESSNKAGGEDATALRKRIQRPRAMTTQSEKMTCPLCHFIFPQNEPNSMVNIHIDKCLGTKDIAIGQVKIEL